MTQADHIIALFGGITSLSRILGHKHPTTVQGWKDRGLVPAKHHQTLIDVGRDNDVSITPADFFVDNKAGPAGTEAHKGVSSLNVTAGEGADAPAGGSFSDGEAA